VQAGLQSVLTTLRRPNNLARRRALDNDLAVQMKVADGTDGHRHVFPPAQWRAPFRAKVGRPLRSLTVSFAAAPMVERRAS
jgi:hypothetical protein